MRASLRHRDDDDRGAVLVEAAFVLPIVVVLVFTVIEFGFLFASKSTTVSSSRDGARFGSANFAVAANKAQAANAIRDVVVKDLKGRTGLDTPTFMYVYKADTNGQPLGGAGYASCTASCWSYRWNGTNFIRQGTSPGWTTPGACLPALDSIGVTIQMRHNYLTQIIGSNLTFEEHTVLQLEPLPTNQCA